MEHVDKLSVVSMCRVKKQEPGNRNTGRRLLAAPLNYGVKIFDIRISDQSTTRLAQLLSGTVVFLPPVRCVFELSKVAMLLLFFSCLQHLLCQMDLSTLSRLKNVLRTETKLEFFLACL